MKGAWIYSLIKINTYNIRRKKRRSDIIYEFIIPFISIALTFNINIIKIKMRVWHTLLITFLAYHQRVEAIQLKGKQVEQDEDILRA